MNAGRGGGNSQQASRRPSVLLRTPPSGPARGDASKARAPSRYERFRVRPARCFCHKNGAVERNDAFAFWRSSAMHHSMYYREQARKARRLADLAGVRFVSLCSKRLKISMRLLRIWR